jgi:protein-S-isoprenylcysteine O-methyltransferase Ste14
MGVSALGEATGVFAYVLLFATLLFLPARTMHWRAAWVLLAVLVVVRGASTILLWRTQRTLLEKRSGLPLPRRGQPVADRILLPSIMAAFAGIVFFTSWDVWHRHLLPTPPVWLRASGLLLFAVGWWIVHLALRSNAFAITVVRHQGERDHRVVDTGAYAVVRHPMYAGLVPVMAGLALWLGSTAGVLAAAIPTMLLAVRIVHEERLLRAELPGYDEYARRVRARLVPGVW